MPHLLCNNRCAMREKKVDHPHQLQYSDFDSLAAFLRTYLFADGETPKNWRAVGRLYAKKNPDHTKAVVDDLNQLLADPRATDDQVSLWLRTRTASKDGRLEPEVPVRHSLLELRDLLYSLAS